MPDKIEVYGDFIRLTAHAWVRHEAIAVIRERVRNDGETHGSEVVVRAASTGTAPAYVLWTDYAAVQIIDAISYCSGLSPEPHH